MIAPSEKHLEDWIVNNLASFRQQVNLPIRRMVSRQQVLPSGRSDLIMAMICNLTVFELKKGEINGETVAQLFRYMGDLKDLHDNIYSTIHDINHPLAHTRSINDPLESRFPIHGVLIGHSITKEAVWVCSSFRIDTILYDYTENGYSFEDWSGIDAYTLTDAMKELMRHMKLHDEDPKTLVTIYESEGSR